MLLVWVCHNFYREQLVLRSSGKLRVSTEPENIKNYWNEDILDREPREKHNKINKEKEIIYDKDQATKAFDTILQLRDVDNTLMWNRINLLLVFQGVLIAAVAAGIKDLSTEKYSLLFAAIIIFGLFSSLMLFNIARGGSWWVSHWEKHLAKIEYNLVGDINIFREHISNKPELKRIWNKEGYVSTRDTIINFTSVFPLIWAILLLIFLSGFSSSPTNTIDNFSCLCGPLIGKT